MLSLLAVSGVYVGMFVGSGIVIVIGLVFITANPNIKNLAGVPLGILFMAVGLMAAFVSFLSYRHAIFAEEVASDLREQGIVVDADNVRSGGNPHGSTVVIVYSDKVPDCGQQFYVSSDEPHKLVSKAFEGKAYSATKVNAMLAQACE